MGDQPPNPNPSSLVPPWSQKNECVSREKGTKGYPAPGLRAAPTGPLPPPTGTPTVPTGFPPPKGPPTCTHGSSCPCPQVPCPAMPTGHRQPPHLAHGPLPAPGHSLLGRTPHLPCPCTPHLRPQLSQELRQCLSPGFPSRERAGTGPCFSLWCVHCGGGGGFHYLGNYLSLLRGSQSHRTSPPGNEL